MNSAALEIIFLWHMHQPDYRDHERGEFVLPWVYLHAIKDYADMASHLERHPHVRAVVNFVPVLLDQLEDYAAQFESGRFRDPLLRLLVAPEFEQLSMAEHRHALANCFHGNHYTMVEPFPPYKRLHSLFKCMEGSEEAALRYLSDEYLADLVTWFHLGWMGETVRRQQPLVAALMAKGEGYSRDERVQLATLIGELVRGIIPRYRALAERGQIELSTTPHTHPLAPLMIDFASAREALPGIELPQASSYPGGRMRVAAQIESAISTHAARFGTPPVGVWPAEGAVSEALLKLLCAAGCRWSAASESVLAASLKRAGSSAPRERYLYRPYRLEGAPGMALFFRDEKLSDLIGFDYRHWHGRDAALDFMGRLRAIRTGLPADEAAVVAVILDGENAWEYYPYNGYYFFEDLYGLLENDATLATTTFTDYLARHPQPVDTLPSLAAGSWVHGTFSTWIGHPEKNRAWDLLCSAKQSYDLVTGSGRLSNEEERRAARQLAVCESSDWFWWLGDRGSTAAVVSLDRLFRLNLANLYRRLRLEPPAVLAQPLAHSGGAAGEAGAMRRAT